MKMLGLLDLGSFTKIKPSSKKYQNDLVGKSIKFL